MTGAGDLEKRRQAAALQIKSPNQFSREMLVRAW